MGANTRTAFVSACIVRRPGGSSGSVSCGGPRTVTRATGRPLPRRPASRRRRQQPIGASSIRREPASRSDSSICQPRASPSAACSRSARTHDQHRSDRRHDSRTTALASSISTNGASTRTLAGGSRRRGLLVWFWRGRNWATRRNVVRVACGPCGRHRPPSRGDTWSRGGKRLRVGLGQRVSLSDLRRDVVHSRMLMI